MYMKILQIINSLNTGGAEKFIVEISSQLKQDGHDVEVMYSDRYSVIHTHLTYAQLWCAVVSLINFKGKKLITTEHSNFNNRRGNKLLKCIDQFIYSRYKVVMCISQTTRQSLIDWIKPKSQEKFVVIPNCVDIDKFRNIRTPIDRTSFGISYTDKVIMMIGRMSEAKDQITLIKAVEELPGNYKCILVGAGNTIEIVKNSVLNKDKIIFTGERSDISSLLDMCDIYVQSSHWEGLPTTVLEAMAARKVVFGSNVNGNIDIIPKDQLFDQGNVNKLIELIRDLNIENIDCLLQNQEQILQEYSLCKIIKLIENNYTNE